jgi:hypothetical protein
MEINLYDELDPVFDHPGDNGLMTPPQVELSLGKEGRFKPVPENDSLEEPNSSEKEKEQGEEDEKREAEDDAE